MYMYAIFKNSIIFQEFPALQILNNQETLC